MVMRCKVRVYSTFFGRKKLHEASVFVFCAKIVHFTGYFFSKIMLTFGVNRNMYEV
jgi:hypothetical protein